MKVLTSEIDESVNFIVPYGKGMLESRYVRRHPDYFICYLSSQSGCIKSCKFCHLTTTQQKSYDQADIGSFHKQALEVFKHYRKKDPARVVNFNWMARGEALDNPYIIHDWRELSSELMGLALKEDHLLDVRFNISTIIPKTLMCSLNKAFGTGPYPTIYYSLYSMDQEWRDKWLPGAKAPDLALDELKRYQDITQKIVYIHGAFIKDENDSLLDIAKMCQAIQDRGLIIKWNMVRYNPFSSEEGEESSNYQGIYNLLDRYFPGQVQIVSRVGPDCQASCGMFYSGELYE